MTTRNLIIKQTTYFCMSEASKTPDLVQMNGRPYAHCRKKQLGQKSCRVDSATVLSLSARTELLSKAINWSPLLRLRYTDAAAPSPVPLRAPLCFARRQSHY